MELAGQDESDDEFFAIELELFMEMN
jgi:hypothetical protein